MESSETKEQKLHASTGLELTIECLVLRVARVYNRCLTSPKWSQVCTRVHERLPALQRLYTTVCTS